MTDYLKRLGIALDEALNVLLLNGDPAQTISYHAAVAERDGKRWGCWLCWFLARAVQRQHCPLQLAAGVGEPVSASIRAGVLLVGVAVLLVALVDHFARFIRHLL